MAKIWIVDNDIIGWGSYDELWKAGGHETVMIDSGMALQPRLKTEKPDVMIVNLDLDDLELSFLEKIPAEIRRTITIVVFSEEVSPELERRALTMGAVEVHKKTADRKEFCGFLVRNLLARIGKISEKSGVAQKKIMVVDDEKAIRDLLVLFFQGKGYAVVTAGSGHEALKLFTEENPDVVLLDVSMPGMNGIEALQKIRALNSRVGVIMATGFQDEELIRKGTELGAYAYAMKPFDFNYVEMLVLTQLAMAA